MGKRKVASPALSSTPEAELDDSFPTSTNILTSPQMLDVWLNIIGPLLQPQDIMNLSMVCRGADDIAQNIRTHQGSVLIRKRLKCHRICKAWPNFKIDLQLHNWKQGKKTSTTLLCRPFALQISSSTLNSLDFVDSSRLEKLHLLRVTLSNKNVLEKLLVRCPALKSFHVTSWSSDVVGSWLVNSLSHVPHLDHLQIRVSSWYELAVTQFGSALQHLVNLRSLDLTSSCQRVDLIAPHLCHLTNITDLNMNSNYIGVGANHLVQALKAMPNMTSLSLEGNSFGDQGFAHLVAPLASMSQLITLLLGFNDLNEEGAKHLVVILGGKLNLQTLSLSGNRLGKEGIELLIPIFQQTTKLSKLRLSGNGFSEADCNQFRARLPHISQLTV
eukprot:c12659_g1_i3.p1 GENE.c12659_g1_i3~~c12659_g1_i3.p1  ORF type:complete len:386 (+),score=74.73 c12659_g1_i3:183-1340(+)